MKQKDTPAWRLHDILKLAGPTDPSQPITKVWSTCLGLPANDLQALYRALVALQELVIDTETRIRRLPDVNHALYLRSMPTIKEALSISNLDQAWRAVQIRLTDTAIADLAFCADILSKTHAEEPISKDDLQWIQDEVNNLFDEVLASDLPKVLRESVLDLLETMRTAIANYRIRGASALRAALATSIGHLVLRYPDVRTSKGSPALNRLWKFVVRLDCIVCKALTYQPLLEASLPILLGDRASE